MTPWAPMRRMWLIYWPRGASARVDTVLTPVSRLTPAWTLRIPVMVGGAEIWVSKRDLFDTHEEAKIEAVRRSALKVLRDG